LPYTVFGKGYNSITTEHRSVGTSKSVIVTKGTFAAILSSNMTAYFTTLNAQTVSISASARASGHNGSSPTFTTASNRTVTPGSPVPPQQTVSIGPAHLVNQFSLLVAIIAIAVTL
jgi:hypothetical protein